MAEKDGRPGRRRRSCRRRRGGGLLLLVFWAVVCAVLMYWFVGKAFSRDTGPDRSFAGPAAPDRQDLAPASSEEAARPWYLTLVNQWDLLPDDFVPELTEVPGGEQVDRRIYEPLMELLKAAEEEGLGPIVASGYRTWERQQQLYDEKVREYQDQGCSEEEAVEQARRWVAEPGTSEHQLGLAVDINGACYDIYLWLQANSYRYGFIFRYPGDKSELTGVAQEVWHYRYVGEKAAQEIHDKGLCLEEYLEQEGV